MHACDACVRACMLLRRLDALAFGRQHGLEVHFWTSSKHQAATFGGQAGGPLPAQGPGDSKEEVADDEEAGEDEGGEVVESEAGQEGAADKVIMCKECQVCLHVQAVPPLAAGAFGPALL